MSKIRVLLSYPWAFTDSPYYNYLKSNPPKGVQLIESNKKNELLINPKKISLLKDIKNNLRNFISKYNLSKPNIHNPKPINCDLLHCAHHLSSTNCPWLMDVEGLFQLYIGSSNPTVDKKVEKILLNKNCKKIMPWTNNLRKELQKKFPKIKNKLEVVYPAVPIQIKKLKKKKGKINLLFVGRYFYMKGGLHALETMNILTKKYENVFGTIISNTPKIIIEKYSSNKKLKFYNLMSQKKLKNYYKNSNIFIYPGYTDSFGFCFLEAMSYGLPTITINGKNRNEIIENNKDGIIINYSKGITYDNIDGINKKVIKKMIKSTEKLILNKNLREKMSKNSFLKIKEGKFSIKERNKKLLKIYKEATK